MKTKQLFTATWCGPCIQLKSILKTKGLSPEYIDVDDQEIGKALVKKFNVRAVPTLVVSEGDTFETFTGYPDIISELEKPEDETEKTD